MEEITKTKFSKTNLQNNFFKFIKIKIIKITKIKTAK